MKLSILIPSLTSRSEILATLMFELNRQIHLCPESVGAAEILTDVDNGEKPIGRKRNDLLLKAQGEYVCFFDDDDWPGGKYISHIFDGIREGKDCVSLLGVITWDGANPEIFEHSVRYPAYRTNSTGGVRYERFPNHLNAIRADIARRFSFPETNHGEDTDWATQVKNSGLIRTEHTINEIIYHYKFKTVK